MSILDNEDIPKTVLDKDLKNMITRTLKYNRSTMEDELKLFIKLFKFREELNKTIDELEDALLNYGEPIEKINLRDYSVQVEITPEKILGDMIQMDRVNIINLYEGKK